jgi:L-rhamnose mutarotase
MRKYKLEYIYTHEEIKDEMADILKSCVTKNSLIKMGEIIQR